MNIQYPDRPEALAALLLDASFKGTLVLVGGFGLARLLRRASASERHLVWTLAVGSLLALPILSLLAPTPGGQVFPSVTVPAREPDPGPSYVVAAPASGTLRPASLALLVWACGAAVVLLRAALGGVAATRVVRRSTEWPAGAAHSGLPDLLAHFGLGDVRLRRGERSVLPMAAGVFRPTVILPASASEWPPERLRAVLVHELAHIRRLDIAVHWMSQLAVTIYWFHPLVWAAVRKLRDERERACDDHVLRAGIRPSEYAADLVEVARSLKRASGAALAMARVSRLESRVSAIVDSGLPRHSISRRASWSGAFAAAGAVFLLTAAGPAAQMAGRGGISGFASDAVGVIPKAAVAIRGVSNGLEYWTSTDPEGRYSFASLPAGRYELQILHAGFKPYLRAGIVLDSGAHLRLDATLEIGAIREKIIVSTPGPQPPPPAAAPQRVRVGGSVQPAKFLAGNLKPQYPAAARDKGITGPVQLRGVITTDGSVISLTVIDAPDPLLATAALEAVRHWRYEPARLNGQPVEVIATVTVSFEFDGGGAPQ